MKHDILIIAPESPLIARLVECLVSADARVSQLSDSVAARSVITAAGPAVVLVDWSMLTKTESPESMLPGSRASGASPLYVLLPEAPAEEEPVGADIEKRCRQDAEAMAEALKPLLNGVRRDEPHINAVEMAGDEDQVSCHGLMMDRLRLLVSIDGRDLHLTRTEFRILWTLAQRPGFPVSRSDLAETCLTGGEDVDERTIDVHVRAIRRKLEDRADIIETVRGVGYRFRDCRVCTGRG